jgi:hypothetical protein
MADLLFSLGPQTTRTMPPVATQLLDELPVADCLPAESAFRHFVSGEKGVDLGEDGVRHASGYMRVSTRTQYPYAGIGPILRVGSRSGRSKGMAEGVEIDLAKLRQMVIENTGPGRAFTRRSLSLAATDGRNPDLIRDIMRVDKRKPTIESVSGICKALGVPLSVVVKGVDLTTESLTEWLRVSGAVAAGTWREQAEWPRDDWYEIEVDINTEPGRHVGSVVEGRSMDKVLPPGTVLRWVDVIGSGIEPVDGDYVIVEQKRGDLYETTVKRLSRRVDGAWELCAESTLPEFREPIFIGRPSEAGQYDGMGDETRVKGIVIDAYLPLRRRRKRSVA